MPTKEEIREHNFFQRRRRLGVKIPKLGTMRVNPVLHDSHPFYHHLIYIQNQLNSTLELWFEEELVVTEQNKAAELIYNDTSGPLIHTAKGRYGISETKDAISCLKQFQRLINEGGNSHLRHHAYEIIKALPFPISLHFDKEFISSAHLKSLARNASELAIRLEAQLKNQPRGNARAYRTALALRAAYEYYCREEITIGTDPDTRMLVGRYCRCLDEVYELVGLKVKVMGYAERAKKCPDSDPLLNNYRKYFRIKMEAVGHHPLIYSKFGWVENMTFREKLINLIAVKCNKLEFLQCYNRPLKNHVYMTTRTKSSILSRLAQNVRNGAIEGLARLF